MICLMNTMVGRQNVVRNLEKMSLSPSTTPSLRSKPSKSMTQSEVLIQYGWLVAVVVSIGVISWTSLLLQAIFHDKRIALVGVFGSLLVAFVAVFPELISFAGQLKMVSAFICAVFMLWFLVKNHNKAKVYLPVLGVVFSAGIGYWIYQMYQAAGVSS